MYTNIAHLNFSYDGNSYSSAPDRIVSLVSTAQQAIASWSAQFSDGPNGDGPQNYVSQGKGQGIGPLPSDTVLDYRVQNHPMLWTTAPVNLARTFSSR